MASTAKTVEAKIVPGVTLAILLGLFMGLPSHARGDDNVFVLERTITNLGLVKGYSKNHQSKNDAREQNLLNASKNRLNSLPTDTDYEDHRAEALKDVLEAIDDFNQDHGDPAILNLVTRASEDLKDALALAKKEPAKKAITAVADSSDDSDGNSTDLSPEPPAPKPKPAPKPAAPTAATPTPASPGAGNAFGSTAPTPAPTTPDPASPNGSNGYGTAAPPPPDATTPAPASPAAPPPAAPAPAAATTPTPALAKTNWNGEAINLLTQAETSTNETHTINLLKWAWKDLARKTSYKEDLKANAVTLIDAAIDNLGNNEEKNAANEIAQALDICTQRGGDTDPNQKTEVVATPAPTPAPAPTPTSPAPAPPSPAPSAPPDATASAPTTLAPAPAKTAWNATAIGLLSTAVGSPDATQGANLLNQALSNLNQTTSYKEDLKTKAIAFIQTAITDLKNNDKTKATQDIAQAMALCMERGGDVDPNQNTAVAAATTPPPASALTAPPVPAPATTAPAAMPGKMTEDQAAAVVLIKGDIGGGYVSEGTGFLVKTPDGPVVFTNIHVISGNPNLQITTTTGVVLTVLSCKGASDRDLAEISVKDGNFTYLELATDVPGTVQTGDDVITPGNSEGGEVMLNTNGKVLGIGPDRIEFSNPIYHGNSGGPVFQVKTGKVIGIVTEAMKVEHSDDLDKASQASHQSAISGSMRYFGMRLDNVPQWEPYDWRRFQIESTFLEQFDQRSQYIISYFTYLSNLDSAAKKTKDKKPASADHDGVDPNLWQQDKDIFKANENYFDRATEDADSSEKLAALNEWFGEINDIANSNMDAIQNPANFYSFDQKKAQEEAAERKEIITDMDKIGNEFSRLGSMPRSNN